MSNLVTLLPILVIFFILSLSADRIGKFTADLNLPRITGYLIAGILIGPFVLKLITKDALPSLLFIDEISLGFIAFAAGSELYLPELRGRLRSIGWVSLGNVIVILIVGITSALLLADYIPFTKDMDFVGRVAVAVLLGALLIARSPSSAIAIINELRAKGPFTQVVMGVTVFIDVIVIIIFATSGSIADALLTNVPLSPIFFFLILFELLIACVLSFFLYLIIAQTLAMKGGLLLKSIIILALGYSIFLLSAWVRHYSHDTFHLEILIEPLLVCTFAGLLVNNRSPHRTEFHQILHDVGPFIYVAFFTLTGASLELDLLGQVWIFALIFFVTRLIGVAIGSWIGGTIAGENPRTNRLIWMAFITQAGVALGLAKEVAVEFPEFGSAFATLVIAVVIINQVLGPPIFKYTIGLVGEARLRAQPADFDGSRDAIIFGLTSQGIALARQLQAHHWITKIAATDQDLIDELAVPDVVIEAVPDFSLDSLRVLKMERMDGVVLMLSDEQNCAVCERIYESFGIENVVAFIKDRACAPRLQELGALTVDRETAVVSLLDHFVRSPSVTSILIGEDQTQDIIEVVLRDSSLHGKLIRELSLPLDVLLLSIKRGQETLVIHGYTRLELGDKVTMVGVPDKLEEVTLLFDE